MDRKNYEGFMKNRVTHTSETGGLYILSFVDGDENLGKFITKRGTANGKFREANPKISEEMSNKGFLKKINHILVSIFYSLVQLVLNLIIIYSSLNYVLGAFFLITVGYAILRLYLEGRHKLFTNY